MKVGAQLKGKFQEFFFSRGGNAAPLSRRELGRDSQQGRQGQSRVCLETGGKEREQTDNKKTSELSFSGRKLKNTPRRALVFPHFK
jgi:hypothetical protein